MFWLQVRFERGRAGKLGLLRWEEEDWIVKCKVYRGVPGSLLWFSSPY